MSPSAGYGKHCIKIKIVLVLLLTWVFIRDRFGLIVHKPSGIYLPAVCSSKRLK